MVETPMIVLGIDPGPEMSALVVYDGAKILQAQYLQNWAILSGMKIQSNEYSVAIEFPEARGGGVPVSQGILDTAGWAGTFNTDRKAMFLKPRDIRIHLCGTAMATRAQVRQALIDQIGPVGDKANPGPLYAIGGRHTRGEKSDDGESITAHLWDALAVAVVGRERLLQK